MEYKFTEIEKKWQQHWEKNGAYKVSNDSTKPKYYVLDMFPYPSGAGLHVGHPLGYIASDIYARYKRLKGFNVLHPMGYDAFGLPAEQYAIEHGIHPTVSTAQNISNYRRQLDNLALSFDWSREINTSEPGYYKWTQWIFLQLFDSWYNRKKNKAERISELVKNFEQEGNTNYPCPGDASIKFTAAEWRAFSEKRKQEILMEYRLSYCGYGEVNWCEALGTVLANDEVINGVSERGGYPVVKKKLRQWYLRITEYADRLLQGLEQVEYSEAMKEMQTNWIGKSYGAEITFEIKATDNSKPGTSNPKLTVYTTRPDTIFGVDFMVVAPEHELIEKMTTPAQKQAVEEYIAYVNSRSDRERMAEKKITGEFTGAYATNPFNGREIPIWISEYVLAGYGTGAIMAVPCGDERDHKFANHFNIPITNIIGKHYDGKEANPTKDAILENSDFLNGIVMRDAIEIVNKKLEEMGIGIKKVNYKMRDAAFSRQRYWGEPFPIIWKDGVAYPLPESELPLKLAQVDSYKPGPEGEGPLANVPEWTARHLETNTMPGYAGSSWYFFRYMDPKNDKEFCNRKVSDYWGQVDLYIGGTEHAVGHLLYSRMWTKALYDLGYIGHEEPYKKLVNQGMIQGVSELIYRLDHKGNFIPPGIIPFIGLIQLSNERVFTFYCSSDLVEIQKEYEYPDNMKPKYISIHLPIECVEDNLVNIEKLISFQPRYKDDVFICKDGYFLDGKWYNTEADLSKRKEINSLQFKSIPLVEKMSKSKLNVVNPDYIVSKFGADTFRMYEMFLGPVQDSKPWDTKGIEGVHRFIKKTWRLFYDEMKGKVWNDDKPTPEQLKVLHKGIKKIEEDNERFSFNTGVSAFMILVNDLTDLKTHNKEILEPLLILLSPYAPHVSEELWHLLGHTDSVLDATFPTVEHKYLAETSKEYPVSVNGKLRTTMNIALDAPQETVEQLVLSNDVIQKWMEGKPHKKIIYVKGKMVNVVV